MVTLKTTPQPQHHLDQHDESGRPRGGLCLLVGGWRHGPTVLLPQLEGLLKGGSFIPTHDARKL